MQIVWVVNTLQDLYSSIFWWSRAKLDSISAGFSCTPSELFAGHRLPQWKLLSYCHYKKSPLELPTSEPQVFNQETLHTFLSDTLAAGEDSVVDAEGNMWKLASLGDLTISFWRYSRWCLNFETHASKESCDFTWRKIHHQESSQDTNFLHNLL